MQIKIVATRLQKMNFVETGCLINAITTEKENIIALSLYYTLGKYHPSDKYTQTYKNKNVIKIYKTITELKPTKTNTLTEIYQNKNKVYKGIIKNKTNIENNLKYKIK